MAFFKDLKDLVKQLPQTWKAQSVARETAKKLEEVNKVQVNKPIITGLPSNWKIEIPQLVTGQEKIFQKPPKKDLPIDTSKGERLINILKDVTRTFPREGAGAVMEVIERVSKIQPGSLSITPGRGDVLSKEKYGALGPKVEKFLFGDKPVESLSKQGEETLRGFGVSELSSKQLGLTTGMVFLGLDLLPPGGKDIVKLLAKTNKAEDVLKILKTLKGIDNAKITDNIVDVISKTTDEKIIKGIVENLKPQELIQPAKKVGEVPEVPQNIKKYVNEYEELKQSVKNWDEIEIRDGEPLKEPFKTERINSINRMREIENGSFTESQNIKPYLNIEDNQPLIQEARKYKSAEEFVNKNTELNYIVDKDTNSLSVSSILTKEKTKGIGMATEKLKNVLNKEGNPKYLFTSTQSSEGKLFFDGLEKKGILKKLTFDEYSYLQKRQLPRGDYEINYSKLNQTKSQLTTIWKEANKGVEKTIPKQIEATPKTLEKATLSEIQKKPGSIKLAPTTYDQTRATQLKTQPELGEQVLKGQSPIQKESLDKSYQIFGNKSSIIKEVEKTLSPIEISPNKIGIFKKFSNTIKDYWISANEFIQDDWYRVRKLVNQRGIKVSDASDPYMKRELFFGRIGSRLEEAKDIIKSIDKDILDTSKRVGVKDKQLTEEVNQYLYLRHAPERNEAIGIGAAGITSTDARLAIKEIEKLPRFKEVVRIADKLQDVNNKTLDVLLDGEVINKELYNTLRSKYKHHIPLQRIFEETENVSDILIGKGLDVRGSGVYKAVGSQRKVADIFTNIVQNYDQALIRSEKNKVDLATLKFARENKFFNGLFEEIKPKAIGTTFEGKTILKEVRDPQILSLREMGNPVYLKINDPRLAIALRGVNRQKLDGVMRVIGGVTRWFAGLATRFNPEFAIPNKIRDLQEMAVYMASKKEIGFKGGVKSVIRDPKSAKDVIDYMRGINSDGANLYKELKMNGGTTGGLSLSTRKNLELDIESIRQMNRRNPKKAIEKVVKYVDDWNTIFEDSTRLSVYKESLASGLTKERAAALAKEATINFNRMGTGGPLINGLYMFSNASIQGSVKMLRAMKNPKVAAVVISSVVGAVFASQEWNDSIDPDWRDKVSKWDRMNGLVVVLPSFGEKFNYITIPVSWGIKPINVMSNYAVDLMNDKGTDIEDALSGILASAVDAYNPVGGTDVFQAATPTILDVPLDISRNRKWSGNSIRPDFDKYMPSSESYFNSLKDTILGKSLITITNKISKESGGRIEFSPADVNYGIEQLIGGAGRTITKTLNTMVDLFKSELPPAEEIPFISRFLKSKDVEETGYGAMKAGEITDILTEQSRERISDKREAESIYEELSKLPTEQAVKAFEELLNTNKDMAQKISDIGKEEKLGLTYTDRLIKQLGVENGERAKYLKSQFDKLEDDDAKAELWQELVDKKLITKQVSKQIIWLINN